MPPQSSRRLVRKSRWGPEQMKVVIPGLPTFLPVQLEEQQLQHYLKILRVEDLTRRLRINEAPRTGNRSPSPEPEYGPDGKRTNTRELRYRAKLDEERIALVDHLSSNDPTYRPPAGKWISLAFSVSHFYGDSFHVVRLILRSYRLSQSSTIV